MNKPQPYRPHQFVLTVRFPGGMPEAAGSFATKREAIEAFELWEAKGAEGQVCNIMGPPRFLNLPSGTYSPTLKGEQAKKRVSGTPLKHGRPVRAGETAMVSAWGESKSLSEWSKDSRAKAHYSTIRGRLKMSKPWSTERAISTPAKESVISATYREKDPKYEAYGETKTFREWVADSRCKSSAQTVRSRLLAGMSLEQALNTRLAHGDVLRYEAFGESKSISQWAADSRCKVSYKTVEARIRVGVPVQNALSKLKSLLSTNQLEAFGETRTLGDWITDDRCRVSKKALRHRLRAGMAVEWSLSELEKPVRPTKS